MVLTPGKVQCSPSSPCSRCRARCASLRAAARLSVRFTVRPPPFRSMATMIQAGTGKQAHQPNWKDGRSDHPPQPPKRDILALQK